MRLPRGKVIFTASLNGAFVTKEMNPNVPEQPDEIAQASLECYNAGAAIVHIHARDEQGKPCGTKEKFAEIQDAVKAKCKEVIVQFSTGGGTNLTIEERVSCLDADPEMASLNMGTLMRQTGPNAGQPFSNMTKDIEAWAAKMKAMHIKPEMECYSQSMYRDVHNLIKKDLIEPPYYVNFVLGMMHQGAIEATPETLDLDVPVPAGERLLQHHRHRRRRAAGDDHGHDPGRLRARRPRGQHLLLQGRPRHEQRSARRAVRAHRQGAQPRAGHAGRDARDPRRGEEVRRWTHGRSLLPRRARARSSSAAPAAWAAPSPPASSATARTSRWPT